MLSRYGEKRKMEIICTPMPRGPVYTMGSRKPATPVSPTSTPTIRFAKITISQKPILQFPPSLVFCFFHIFAGLIENPLLVQGQHGPTCAFKDMALQILPYLLTTSAKKTIDGKKISILVATSGDTGKAALEGFKDVDGTSIMVFYPEDGVSNMQKRQMTTQEGSNVNVCAVVGNFDDCQSGVKQIFTDKSVIRIYWV